ncbi:helicase RepA family protein [Mesorhizobium sp. M0814]|uniref:AAA family ATPase n=1 Tax=Mesorhizobium sp. M0814 TaxID=2957004 RepID=UPI00333590F6
MSSSQPKERTSPPTIDVKTLMARSFNPICYIVPGYVAEGLTLLAGAPKLGKSWLCLEIALAVASGGTCLGGVQCKKGHVLYLALEDNERRLQSRIRTVWARESQAREALPEGLDFATAWHRSDQGGLSAIREWLTEHPLAKVVIVDVLAAFKPPRRKDQQQYDMDYASLRELQQIGAENGIAIIVAHHTRKGVGDFDPFEAISGTQGLSGAADTALVLRRDGNGTTLYGRGRDIEEFETALEFDRKTCRWRVLGPAIDVLRTSERTQILTVLERAGRRPMKPAEIADKAGKSSDSIRQLLFKMTKVGEVIRTKQGYLHPDHSDHGDNAESSNTIDDSDTDGW